MDELSGCWEKLSRAQELTKALEREVKRVSSEKYLEFDLGGRDGVELVVHSRRQPPWDRWGVLVGEIVHDLRSALDHAVWILTVVHSGPAPDPPTGWWKRVEFPIFTDAALFRAQGLKDDLRGVDRAVVLIIESLQPYKRAPSRPERQPLAVLHNLSIRDKHRALPLAAIVGRGGTIKARSGSMTGRSRLRSVPAPIPERAAVARLSTLSGPAADIKIGDRVEIEFGVDVDVGFAFAPGPPAYGGELVPKLRTLYAVTARALHLLGDPRLF